MNKLFYIIFFLNCIFLFAQDKEKEKALLESNNLIFKANEELAEENFVEAEANYRRAISKNGESATAKYNLGNTYYEKNSLGEAHTRYKQAGEIALTKEEKQKAYHNMGNVFMKNKEYEKAVEAYKEALRNNPSDEETRYNLALAKEMLKKQQEEQQQNDQNQDNENQDQKQNEDQKDQNKDQEKNDEGEEKKDEEGEQKDENQDEGENEDQGDKEQNENKEGEGDEQKDQQQQNKDGEKKEDENSQQQASPNQMSPQQVKNMLKAIEDQEKKVQEKVNAQKVKGRPVQTDKDW